MDHMVPVTTTYLCHDSMRTAIENMLMSEGVCIPIKLCLQSQAVRSIWPVGYSLPTLGLGNKE